MPPSDQPAPPVTPKANRFTSVGQPPGVESANADTPKQGSVIGAALEFSETPLSVRTASSNQYVPRNKASATAAVKNYIGADMLHVPASSFAEFLWPGCHIPHLVEAAKPIHTSVSASLEGIHAAKSENGMCKHITAIMDEVIAFNPLIAFPSPADPPTAATPPTTTAPLKYLSNPNVIPGGKQHGLRPDGILVEARVAREFEALCRGKGGDRAVPHDDSSLDENKENDLSGLVVLGQDVDATEEERVRAERQAEYDKAMRMENAAACRRPSSTTVLSKQMVLADLGVTAPISAAFQPGQKQDININPAAFLSWARIVVVVEIKRGRAKTTADNTSANSTPVSSTLVLSDELQAGSSSGVPSSSHSQPSRKRKGAGAGDGMGSDPYFKRRKGADGNSESIQGGTKEGASQLGSYMLETRSSLGIRRHTFGCLIIGSSFEVWYADPCGLITSPSLNLRNGDDFAMFSVIMSGLARGSTEVLGLDPRLIRPSTSAEYVWPTTVDGWGFELQDYKVTICKTLHIQWGLYGRNTSVWEVSWSLKNGPSSEQPRVAALKQTYQLASRESESALVGKARAILADLDDRLIQGLIEVFGGEDGELISEIKARKSLTKGNALGNRELDRRIHIVLMELLKPIHALPFNSQAVRCYQDVATVLRALDSRKFQHRDVSIGNILVRIAKDIWRGVLSDLDLAVDRGSGSTNRSRSSHRTGTFPFLALHLLRPPPGSFPDHILRFDLESLFYVIIWHLVRFGNGVKDDFNKAKKRPLDEWLDLDKNVLAKKALASELPELGDYWDFRRVPALAVCAGGLADFSQEMSAASYQLSRRRLGVDDPGWQEMDGIFTEENFSKMFNQLLKSLKDADL